MRNFILAIAIILMPCLAQASDTQPARPHWSLELKGGGFFPGAANWSTSYDSSYTGEYGGAFSFKVRRQIEVGIEGSYGSATGRGQLLQHGTATSGGNDVTFERAPLNLFVLARGVFDENQWLVPYAGGGYTRMFYRSEVKGQGKTEGSVNGYHARGGVQLLLDRLEPGPAHSLYQDFGIYHTYLFVEGRYTRAMADTVPTGTVDLGGTSCLGGFLFEF